MPQTISAGNDASNRLSHVLEGATNRLADIQTELSLRRSEFQILLEQNSAILAQCRASSMLALDSYILNNPRYQDKRCVNGAYGQVYSQNNEDGIIAEIFRRIGHDTKSFVEIAAGNGIENTTRLLLDLGWTGVWIEAGEAEAASIRSHMTGPISNGRLVYLQEKVDRDNVAPLVANVIRANPDFLSLDIDYNTSHIWTALKDLTPRVVCVEYNAHFPPSVDYEVPYDPNGTWNGTTNFGASLKALERIGHEANYSLVGCDIFGVNAFFVRKDLCDEDKFLAPFTAENHYEPPRFNLIGMRGHGRQAQYSVL
ncbi:hypothetical protein QD357_22495 [Rhizobium sp. BR 317]|uniref:hypothetical protein n=1 Tax=Rhizobium sp. BR 317 TaxID=3040015 RepID=UPI0039BF4F3A